MSLQPPARITSPSPEKPASRYDWAHLAKRSRESASSYAYIWERSRFYAKDYIWGALGKVGIGRHLQQRAYSCYDDGGDAGRGLAVLLTGAGDRE